MAQGGYAVEKQTFWPWKFFKSIALPWLKLVSRIEYVHLERIPRTGPFILTPNHHSNLDPLYMSYLVWDAKRLPRFLAKSGIWKIPVVSYVMTATGQIPVERAGGTSKGSLRAAEKLVADGSALIVYPEGTLTREPNLWPMRGKTGAARLALESGVPVIPVAHWGVHEVMPRYGKLSLWPRKCVRILVGEPVDLSPWLGRPIDAAALAEVTEAIMTAITTLLEELRGERAPEGRWDPAQHGQSETGRI